MRSGWGLCAPGALLALVACGNGNTGAAPALPKPPKEVVHVDTAPPPGGYAAELPRTSTALLDWLRSERPVPPRPHVIDHLTDGDAVWLARFKAVAQAIPADDGAAWARIWAGELRFSDASPKFCEITRPWMSGHGHERAALIGVFIRACATTADRAAILREDTPAWAVLRFFEPWQRERRVARGTEYDPRLIAAAREIILAPQQDADSDGTVSRSFAGGVLRYDPASMVGSARETAFTLASIQDARMIQALVNIHSEIKSQEVADEVAMAFTSSRDARLRAIGDAACVRKQSDPSCDPRYRSMPVTDDDAPDEAAVDAAPSLGPTYSFDVETDSFPNGHDSLMRHLASLVAPALDDVIFEETPPAMDDEDGPYEIRAFSGGKRFRRRATNFGDWYDLEAVLDLMNALMVERRAAERFHVLTSDGQMATVIAATPETMAKAAKAGLTGFGDPNEAREAGQGFERQVIEQLEKRH